MPTIADMPKWLLDVWCNSLDSVMMQRGMGCVMSDVTIADMQIAKRKLEQTILTKIMEFEEVFGVTVAFVGSTHSQEMCGRAKTVNVQVEVRV